MLLRNHTHVNGIVHVEHLGVDGMEREQVPPQLRPHENKGYVCENQVLLNTHKRRVFAELQVRECRLTSTEGHQKHDNVYPR